MYCYVTVMADGGYLVRKLAYYNLLVVTVDDITFIK